MILNRIASAIKRQDWFVVVIEILIVVIGIYIGLQVDDWQKERQDRATEQVYLREIYEDLLRDQQEMDDSIETANTVVSTLIEFLEQSALEEPTWDLETMNQNVTAIQRLPTFVPVSRAYTNITGSGDLKIIQSFELKNQLASYFAEADILEIVLTTQEMELVETFQPFIIEHLDYQAVYYNRFGEFALPPAQNPELILDVYKTQAFRNILTQKFVRLADLLQQFQVMKELNENLRATIEAELGGE